MQELKDSGLPWLGKVPYNWENETIRNLLIARDGGVWGDEVPDSEAGTICMRIADFDYGKGKFKDCDKNVLTKRKYPDIQVKRLRLKKGDILIEKSGGGEKTPVGRTVLFDKDYTALFANFMERLRFNVNIVTPEYVEYWLRAWYSCRCSPFYINQTTGIQNINLTLMLAKERIYYPSIVNQEAITAFLNAKCAEVDSLAADIQSQIGILEQYRRSVITEAVTKGLDTDAEMRDSRIPWIGMTPSHWAVKRTKFLFEIVKRIAGKEGFDVLSVTQKGLKVKDLSDYSGQIAENYSGYQFVYPTDYVMNHMDLLTGWVDCSNAFGVTSPDYRVFRLLNQNEHDLAYFKYVFQCLYMNKIYYSFGNGVSGMGRWRLQTSTFLNFLLPVPPRTEQHHIAEFICSKVSEIDSIIDVKKKQLETLDEYKKSFIFEYVTGKKEV